MVASKETAKTAAKPVKASKASATTHVRLRTEYNEKFTAELLKELKLGNVNRVPKLEKIVVNVGLGRAKDDKKIIATATNTLRKITGQQPVETIAKTSIAGFKLREGNMIGLKVTLRGDKMYEFMDRLINVVLPRLRDFHGVSAKAFDRQGNFSLGMTDQSVFPELTFEETTTPHGMQFVFVMKSEEQAHTRVLLEKFGMPFEKPEGPARQGKESK
ncbi:MAG: 50S ribosomal protein L5 [Candidatus Saccharimonadales bacterium]